MTPLCVAGVAGRMGRLIGQLALASPDVVLHSGLVAPESPLRGRPLAALFGPEAPEAPITADAEQALHGCAVLVDFSRAAAVAGLVRAAARRGVALVEGTTGLPEEAEAAIAEAARHVPVVRSANMSEGVNVLLGVLGQVSRALPGFDVQIFEMHHRMKRDAPSGTALRMAQAVGRPSEELGVLAARGGDVAGEHTVFFLGPGERVEITHRASSREIFARGALRAARWVAGRPPGLYDMQDVLGLR